MAQLDGRSLTLEGFGRIVLEGEECSLAAAALERVAAASSVVEAVLRAGEPVYGLNTGFGDLASERIPDERCAELQDRLLRSHAAGVGEPLPAAAVRGMLLLRINALARGNSGVRPVLLERLLEMLNRNLLPVVPSRGSVGASGDLAPLAHLALPLTGRGRVSWEGEELSGEEGLRQAGIEPLPLAPKEGLALINGTQASTALLALAALDCRRLVRIADLIGALSTEAIRGSDGPFDERLHELRPYPGQVDSARNLWRLLQDSEIRESHRRGDPRVQDPYSFRCMPQVHGAARDVLHDAEAKLAIEMNAVTDNPLVFAESGAVLAGGNFHAEPIAFAADFLAIAVTEIASLSERRIEKLNQAWFSGLPAFLTEEPGLNSGFMIPQVTAAALVSENRVLAHPASADSVPTSADKEDHVSMSMGAALKLRQVVANARQVLAIELLCAAQGVDLLRPMRSSEPLEALHAAIRGVVPKLEEDRELAPDLAAADVFLGAGVEPLIDSLD